MKRVHNIFQNVPYNIYNPGKCSILDIPAGQVLQWS